MGLALCPDFVAPKSMFETAELGRELGKKEYQSRIDAARVELLNLQHALLDKGSPAALILIGGVEGAGKGEVLNHLFEWMDARYLHTRAFGPPTEDEAARPRYWRYWMALPQRGHIGVFLDLGTPIRSCRGCSARPAMASSISRWGARWTSRTRWPPTAW